MQLFVKIAGPDGQCPEWTIVELQGDLETKSEAASLSSKFIGDLFFNEKDQPVLIIGHHILNGKVVNLEKPLAVLAKNADSKHLQPSHDDIMETDNEPLTSDGTDMDKNTDIHYHVKAIVKRKILFKTRPKPIIANVAKKL